MKKVPLDYRTGTPGNAHDPSLWLTYETAKALGGHVGFVITAPYFFVDLDSVRIGDAWTPEALAVCARFPGAYVEVSQSGAGLHIIGRYDGARPIHQAQPKGFPGGLYTAARFCHITGAGAQGDAERVHTAALQALIAERFTAGPGDAGAPAEWSTAPCDGWNGPTDDDELITRASKAQSAASRLTGRATFADLFNGHTEALARTYPPDNPADAYNQSAADVALAAHLMFWTGRDCERTERIMRRSALQRSKWDDRSDYLPVRVILYAMARCSEVCNDRPVPLATPAGVGAAGVGAAGVGAAGVGAAGVGAAGVATPNASMGGAGTAPPAVSGFVTPDMQRALWQGVTYVLDADRILIPGGMLLDATQFSRWFTGRYVLDAGNQRIAKTAADALFNSEVNVCPRAMTTCFRPNLAPGVIISEEGIAKVNRYWPVPVRRVKGDATPFLDHVRTILPVRRDQEILLAYMAACAQHVGVKFQYATLLQGAEGNGKTIISKCVEASIGMKYTEWPQAHEISEKYNSWLAGSLLAAVDDVHIPAGRKEILEILKPMITSNRVSIRAMNTDRVMQDTCCNFMFTSNHKDGLPKHKNDRRLAVFFTKQQTREDIERDMPAGYFRKLLDWLERGDGYAIVADYLFTYQIPDELNPALGIRAPDTSTTAEAIAASLGVLEQEVQEAIEAGRQGFKGGWVSSAAVTTLLSDMRMRITPRAMRPLLNSLGYEWHPGLPGGRANNAVMPDNTRSVLYVTATHTTRGLTGADVERAYTAAQMGADVPAVASGPVTLASLPATVHRIR